MDKDFCGGNLRKVETKIGPQVLGRKALFGHAALYGLGQWIIGLVLLPTLKI